jgi:hypothetical protein
MQQEPLFKRLYQHHNNDIIQANMLGFKMNPQYDAQGLAGLGRQGDSMLVHMQPEEVAGLQALAQSQGTSLTTNPDTGLPEAFNLGGVLGAIAPMAAGFALGPGGFALMNPLTAGLTVGALTTALSGGDLGKGLMAGLGGFGGAGLGGTLANAGQGVKASVEQTAANAGKDAFQFGSMDPGAINKPFMPSAPTPAYNANIQTPVGGMVTGPGANSFGPNFNTVSGGGFDPNAIGNAVDFTQTSTMLSPEQLAAQNASSNMSGFDYAMKGAKDLVTPEGFQAFKDAGGSGGQLAMMGGSALLGGLEEKDIYGKPLRAPNDEYDPYARLNLGGASSQGESGLRLLAAGGPVSFAQGGSPALQGGGSGAMQGADPIRVSVSGTSSSSAQPWGGSGLWGSYNRIGLGPSVAPEELGLFADQSMIDAARERQNNALRNQTNLGMYGGMGGMNQPYRGMSGINQGYTGMGGIGGLMGRSSTGNADSIDSLNLDKQVSINLATGGTIGTGGMNDLYAQTDNAPAPALTADGYGMGRLDRLARASADSSAGQYQFAKGGEARYTLDNNSLGGKMFGQTGLIDQLPPHVLSEILGDPGMRQFMGFRGNEEPKYYTAPGMGGGSGALSTSGPRVNLGTVSGVGMAKGGYLDGPGDGMSDSIPATIEGKQPARLADGEFVIPADVVSHLGNGSTKAGSKRLYAMLDKVRHARTGNKKQGKEINPSKYLPI